MKLVLGYYMKVAIRWGRNDTFDRGGCKFVEQKALTSLVCSTNLTITLILISEQPTITS